MHKYKIIRILLKKYNQLEPKTQNTTKNTQSPPLMSAKSSGKTKEGERKVSKISKTFIIRHKLKQVTAPN